MKNATNKIEYKENMTNKFKKIVTSYVINAYKTDKRTFKKSFELLDTELKDKVLLSINAKKAGH